MIRSLTIAMLAGSSLAGPALAGDSHRRAPANAAYYSYYAGQPAHEDARPVAAQPPREDFGSFSAGTVARNLGY